MRMDFQAGILWTTGEREALPGMRHKRYKDGLKQNLKTAEYHLMNSTLLRLPEHRDDLVAKMLSTILSPLVLVPYRRSSKLRKLPQSGRQDSGHVTVTVCESRIGLHVCSQKVPSTMRPVDVDGSLHVWCLSVCAFRFVSSFTGVLLLCVRLCLFLVVVINDYHDDDKKTWKQTYLQYPG